MFRDMDIRTKLFINMIIAQIGMATTSLVALFLDSNTLLITTNIIFGVVIAVISYFIASSMTQSLKQFDSYMKSFLDFMSYKSNRFVKAVEVSNDEIGQMIHNLNETAHEYDISMKEDMRVMGEIVLVTDKVEQGIYGCRVHSSTKNPMVMTLKNTINQMLNQMDKNVNELKVTLESYTNNDYTKSIRIDPKLKAEMLAVMNSVNALGTALATNAKENLSNGQTLEQNSSFMSSSVAHLAQRANEQAASLEETAAALEEITSLTRNNAENASKMATLGTTVKDAVLKGEKMAESTTKAMDEINTQITSINEAITVIDQIAFQTNILSLNAAVEAATAGEAGKGFAVVAGEVRNLASRSAEAAKEIKALVESATQKANYGKHISDEMIKGYHELNTHIGHTIHLISDVSVASKEQMTGIEQINDAVTMLDRVTQENASEANNVANISNEVLELANTLVADAKSKRF